MDLHESPVKSTASVDGGVEAADISTGNWRQLVVQHPRANTARAAGQVPSRRGRSCRASRCCSLQGQLRWRDGLHHQSQEP